MSIDYVKTKEFYENYNDLCDCDMCMFYYENIKNLYPDLSNYLTEKNIDIQKPFEVGYPYIDEKSNLIYPIVQYVVIGDSKEDFSINLDGIIIEKGKFYPNLAIDNPYFVIDIYNLSFDKNILNAEIIKNL